MPAKKVSHSGSIQGPACSGKQRKPEWNHSHPNPAGCVRLQTFFLVFLCVCVCVCVFHSSLSLARDTPSLSLEPIPRDSNRLACYCVLLCPNCRGTLDLWNVGLFPPLLLVSRSVVRCATQYPAQCLMPGPVLSDWLAGPPACIGCLPGVVFCQSSSRWTRAGIGGWRGGCFDGQAADWLRVWVVVRCLASLDDLGWVLHRFTSRASLRVWAGYGDAPLRALSSKRRLALETPHSYGEANNSKDEVRSRLGSLPGTSPRLSMWLPETRQRAFTARLEKTPASSLALSVSRLLHDAIG